MTAGIHFIVTSKSFSVSIDFKAGGGGWCVGGGVKWAVIKVMSLVCTNQNEASFEKKKDKSCGAFCLIYLIALNPLAGNPI